MSKKAFIIIMLIALASAHMVLLAATTSAGAAERVALVIGNSAYNKPGQLKNPRNDAEAVASMLSQFGFDVIKGINTSQYNFKILLRDFTREIKDAKLALFYFAGHGLQVGQRNYLLPTDVELKEETDLDFEAVELNFIFKQMERGQRTNIVLLDACRNNPFAVNLARNMGTRSSAVGSGLAPVETGVDTFVGFATQPGNVALDGKQANSPFTAAILKHLTEPGLDISVLMRRVREEVVASTSGKQVPWSNSSLVGDRVVLNTAAWQAVAKNSAERGICVGTVEECNFEELQKARPAKPINPAHTAALNPATLKPKAGGQGKIKLDLAYWNTIKDTKNPALLNSYLAQFPQGTFADLAKTMIADLERGKSAPEALQPTKQKLASLSRNKAAGAPEPEKTVDSREISRELQAELRRHRCIASKPDGIWGPKSRRALKRYSRYAGLNLESFEPNSVLLDEMRSNKKRVCPVQCGARFKVKNGRCIRKTCRRNQILTKKGNCIAKAKPRKRKRTATRKRQRTQRGNVQERTVEPRRSEGVRIFISPGFSF